MDTYGVAPTPITNGEELLAKMDLILGASQQWSVDGDEELGSLILERLIEVSMDMDTVLDLHPDLDLTPHKEKLAEIKTALSKPSSDDIKEMYRRNQ